MVRAPGSRTPRSETQPCRACATTRTPSGASAASMASAICSVRRSCSWSREESASIVRMNEPRPATAPLGRYIRWITPSNGSRWCSQTDRKAMSRRATDLPGEALFAGQGDQGSDGIERLVRSAARPRTAPSEPVSRRARVDRHPRPAQRAARGWPPRRGRGRARAACRSSARRPGSPSSRVRQSRVDISWRWLSWRWRSASRPGTRSARSRRRGPG